MFSNYNSVKSHNNQSISQREAATKNYLARFLNSYPYGDCFFVVLESLILASRLQNTNFEFFYFWIQACRFQRSDQGLARFHGVDNLVDP